MTAVSEEAPLPRAGPPPSPLPTGCGPWRKPRFLAFTALYLWALLPVALAVLFSFNAGRSRSTWQGFVPLVLGALTCPCSTTRR